MLIDCGSCAVRGTACADCVVSVLFAGPATATPPAGSAPPGGDPAPVAASTTPAPQVHAETYAETYARATERPAAARPPDAPDAPDEGDAAERRALRVFAEAGFEVTVLNREETRPRLRVVRQGRHWYAA